jgi:hypothetical protein
MALAASWPAGNAGLVILELAKKEGRDGRMARINFGRMLLAGLIAAVVFDVLAFVVNRSFLASEWEFALATIGQPAPEVDDVVVANIWRAIAGFSAAWIYAGFRPRFRGNHRTAIIAGITVWMLFGLVRYWAYIQIGLPVDMMIAFAVAAFFELVIASLIGNYFYSEP